VAPTAARVPFDAAPERDPRSKRDTESGTLCGETVIQRGETRATGVQAFGIQVSQTI
jgi:hypothetical protein